MSRIVYLPTGADLAERLRAGEAGGPWLGYTATPGLRAHLSGDGDSQLSDDELQYAALNAAGVAHLTDPRRVDPRLVLSVDVADAQVSDLDSAEPGTATVDELSWRQVTALFADGTDAAGALARARDAARGLSTVAAVEKPEVTALTDAHDLLWYAPDELDALLAG